jgi:putative intracellular protease/amidase
VIDPHSDNASHFRGDEQADNTALAFWHNSPTMENPRSLADIFDERLDRYDARFVPSGHAPLVGLTDSAELGEILAHFEMFTKRRLAWAKPLNLPQFENMPS